MFLAATLFFFPHYTVTHEQGPVSVTADTTGNAYVVSLDPLKPDVGFLTKVDPDGRVIYRLELSHEYAAGAIYATPDAQGNIYAAVGGYDPYNPEFYAIKLDTAGNLVYKFPLGANDASAPAIGLDGSAYFTGGSLPEEWLPTTPGAWVTTASAAKHQLNAFVVKVSPAGNIVYATFLNNAAASTGPVSGSPRYSAGSAIAVDPLGFAYVVGVTSDPAYPVTEGAFQKQYPCANCQSAFATKLSPDGKALAYSTFLGSANGLPAAAQAPGNPAFSLALSANLQVVVISTSSSSTTTFNTVHSMTLRPDGGGVLSDYQMTWGRTGLRAAPDGSGNLFLTGTLTALDIPPAEGALQTGPTMAALLRVSDGAVLYCTRLPFSESDGIAPDGSDGFLVLGKAGAIGQSAWTVTRFVPDNRGRTAVLGVANAAETNTSSAIAPGEIVQISGPEVGPSAPISATYDAGGRLPFNLGGTQLWFNGTPAPILSVAEQQVVAEVPFELAATGTVRVDLLHDATAANTAEFPAGLEPQVIPGPSDASPVKLAAALNQDGTVNSADNPADPGSVVSLFVNGAGAFNPLPPDGTPGQAGQMLVAPTSARVSVGNTAFLPAQMLYAGAAPGLIGVAQVNLRIPPPPYSRPAFGPSLIVLTIGGADVESKIWVATP